MSICSKDLANHWTDMVFIYSEATYRGPMNFITIYGGRVPQPPKDKLPP